MKYEKSLQLYLAKQIYKVLRLQYFLPQQKKTLKAKNASLIFCRNTDIHVEKKIYVTITFLVESESRKREQAMDNHLL